MEGDEDGRGLGEVVGLEEGTSQEGTPARNRANTEFSAPMCSLQVGMSRYWIRLSTLQLAFVSSSVRVEAMDISVATDLEHAAWSPAPCSPQKPPVPPAKQAASNSIGMPRDREHCAMASLSSSTNQSHAPAVSATVMIAAPPASPQLYQAVVGEVDGTDVIGAAVGLALVGEMVGRPVGLLVGSAVVGSSVGPGVGSGVGGSDGEPVGLRDGKAVGEAVGLNDGDAVGGVEGERVVVNRSARLPSLPQPITPSR